MLPIDGGTLVAVAGRHGEKQAAIVNAIGPVLASTLERWGITDRLDIAHFLAQTAHESDCYKTTREYASGAAYEGRLDLGNTQPGDGERFPGMGLIQTTGRGNQKRAAEKLGVPFEKIGEYLQSPIGALESACFFWLDNGLSALAKRDDLIAVTRRVNGGTNGLEHRRELLARAKAVLARLAGDVIVAATLFDQGTRNQVLARGDTGDAVEQLQRTLSALGYAVAIDGAFGAGTEAAVIRFQSNNSLTADGIVGPKTWAKLLPQGA